MPTRSVRRRQHKLLARLRGLAPSQRRVEAACRLQQWRAEAFRRAHDLGAPAVWALAAEAAAEAAALDPSGELAADLARLCSEAVASVAGRHLVRGSRPLADRARLQKPTQPGAAGDPGPPPRLPGT